jgi:cyclic pyranopterin phosphate synthase
LTAKGDLILCLGQEDAISLKDAVRSDLTNDEIKTIIQRNIVKRMGLI